jgi:hypothetical protein
MNLPTFATTDPTTFSGWVACVPVQLDPALKTLLVPGFIGVKRTAVDGTVYRVYESSSGLGVLTVGQATPATYATPTLAAQQAVTASAAHGGFIATESS